MSCNPFFHPFPLLRHHSISSTRQFSGEGDVGAVLDSGVSHSQSTAYSSSSKVEQSTASSDAIAGSDTSSMDELSLQVDELAYYPSYT